MARTVRLLFGRALKLRRRALGYTQATLAQALAADQSTVSKWEERSRPPRDWYVLEQLSEVLKVPLDDLKEGLVPVDLLENEDREWLRAKDNQDVEIEISSRASLLAERDLTPDEERIVAAAIEGMVRELKRIRREEDEAEQRRNAAEKP